MNMARQKKRGQKCTKKVPSAGIKSDPPEAVQCLSYRKKNYTDRSLNNAGGRTMSIEK
jgi:hypothetical protein